MDKLKDGVQFLYQITRQSGVSAELHERCLKEAQELFNHLAEPGAETNSEQPEVISKAFGKRKKETAAA
tara:strand:- start:242 stop:448 length:207 start_codon:yes stop_codon:yes gene_type:complete